MRRTNAKSHEEAPLSWKTSYECDTWTVESKSEVTFYKDLLGLHHRVSANSKTKETRNVLGYAHCRHKYMECFGHASIPQLKKESGVGDRNWCKS